MRAGTGEPETFAERSGAVTSFRLYVLVAAVMTVAVSGMIVTPVALDGITRRFGLSAGPGGAIITVELIASSFTALGLAAVLTRVDVVKLCIAAAAISSIAQLLSGLTGNLPLFVLCRAVSGLSCGVLYAVGCYWASQERHGVRVLSVALLTSNILYGAGLVFWPSAVVRHGLLALYGVLAAAAILLCCLLLRMGNPAPGPAEAGPRASVNCRYSDLALLLVLCVLANGAEQVIWTFSQSTGVTRGFETGQVGEYLGASTAVGIFGLGLAAVFDRRFGLSAPLSAGLAACAAAGFLIGTSTDFRLFAFGLLVYGFSTYFFLPYLLNAGALLDTSGRAATLSAGAVYLAGAIGPLVGGIVADWSSVLIAECGSAAVCLIAAALAIVLGTRVDRVSGADSAARRPC